MDGLNDVMCDVTMYRKPTDDEKVSIRHHLGHLFMQRVITFLTLGMNAGHQITTSIPHIMGTEFKAGASAGNLGTSLLLGVGPIGK